MNLRHKTPMMNSIIEVKNNNLVSPESRRDQSPSNQFKSPEQSPRMADFMNSSPRDQSATMNGSPGIPGISAKTSHETKRRY